MKQKKAIRSLAKAILLLTALIISPVQLWAQMDSNDQSLSDSQDADYQWNFGASEDSVNDSIDWDALLDTDSPAPADSILAEAKQQKIVSDTVHMLRPSNHFLKELRENDDFNYSTDYDENTSYIRYIIQRFFEWIAEKFGISDAVKVYRFFKISIYILFGILVIVLIWHILKINKVRAAKNKSLSIEDIEIGAEDVHNIDFDAMIAEAVAGKQWRLASRFLFLKSLRLLSELGHIEWRIGKTNSQYLRELGARPYFKSFRQMTIFYESVWYGDFPVEESHYEKVLLRFRELNDRLNRENSSR